MIDDIIKKAAENEWSVPMFSHSDWKELRQEYAVEGEIHPGIDTILPAFKRFIVENKPPMPITRPTYREMKEAFYSLQKARWLDFMETDFGEVYNKFQEKVDASGVIATTHTHNSASAYWHNDLRYKCGYQNRPSQGHIWEDPETYSKEFRSLMMFLWREFKDTKQVIDHNKYKEMFRLSGYVATQFKPLVAKVIYDGYRAKRVVDISCGWGDRLAGFYCSKAEEYVGCDPNGEVYEKYKLQCQEYEELLDTPLFPVDVKFTDHGDWFEMVGNKRVRIFNQPAEEVDWDTVLDVKHDLMFTSPPYFGIEKYAGGQEDEDKQSWKRYNEYSVWRDSFFYPVMDAMKKNCHRVMINIVDPVVNGERHPIEADIDKRYGIHEIVGMRMARRPSGQKDDSFIVDGERLNFIEPIYIVEGTK